MSTINIGRFEIKDIINDQDLDNDLRITENSSKLLILIRVLTGGVQIKNEVQEFDQLINFFKMRNSNNLMDEDPQEYIFCIKQIENIMNIIDAQKIAQIVPEDENTASLIRELNKYKHIQQQKIQEQKDTIFPNKIQEINEILDTQETSYNEIFDSERSNHKFYESVLIEVLNFICERNNKNYTSSFIYLYRAYEEISYAYPLIFSYKNGDYKQTFNNFKSFFSDDKNSGELKFCKAFIKQIFKNELSQTIEINFSSLTRDEEIKIKNELKEKINIKNLNFDNDFKIKYEFLFDLVVEIRNKFFHKLRGSKTYIEVKEINIENILSLFLDVFILWFAKITLTVVKEKIS